MTFQKNERLEEALYETVAQEIHNKNINQGLWLKATVDSEGDDFKAKVLYTKYRVKQLEREIEEALKLQVTVQQDQEAGLRQKIVSLRDEGLSFYLIAKDLNDQLIPIPEKYSEFKAWSPELVKLLSEN